jgi:hypothetical protein
MKENIYYQDYHIVFTPDYGINELIKENELHNCEIIQMFQEDKVKGYEDSDELYYQYLIIVKMRLS